MRILIKNGTLIDPANRVQAQLNILTADGKIAAVTAGEPEADLVIDAAGKVKAVRQARARLIFSASLS